MYFLENSSIQLKKKKKSQTERTNTFGVCLSDKDKKLELK